jgi:hypothetical protein
MKLQKTSDLSKSLAISSVIYILYLYISLLQQYETPYVTKQRIDVIRLSNKAGFLPTLRVY